MTLQSLAELFRALTGPKMKVPAALAADIVQEWQDAVIHHGWSFWEAMIWATAKKHGCRILFTEDGQAGRTLGGVTIVNPFGDGGAEFAKAAFGT
ncbi:PIN domain-containing protein [Acidiphilium multivorum]|uniref:PIN domain-containing protein n=1 Tax=Acidiphilium multivorum TaxID=62140 RepID=UPI0011DD7168|nr:PIN domain-containing protein [Acidiphilium multivorum]